MRSIFRIKILVTSLLLTACMQSMAVMHSSDVEVAKSSVAPEWVRGETVIVAINAQLLKKQIHK